MNRLTTETAAEGTLQGRQSLKTSLVANRRLNTAYLLRESFGQLWHYEREAWARRFFENAASSCPGSNGNSFP